MSGSRLRSDFWVAAHLRRCAAEGVAAVLRRRGAAEAGAVFAKVDRLDGTADLFGPAPPSLADIPDARRFAPVLTGAPSAAAEDRFTRELRFDPDLWLIEIEDRAGRHFLETGDEPDF